MSNMSLKIQSLTQTFKEQYELGYAKGQSGIEDLKAQNERLRAALDRQGNQQDRIELWIAQGEQIANRNVGSVAFALGVWWADRPWRTM